MRRLIISALTITAMLLVTAAISDANDEICGCKNNSSGTLRVVDCPGSCRTWEESISWNIQGPIGPQGPPGVCDTATLNNLIAAICGHAATSPGWCSTNPACVTLCPELNYKLVFVSSETYYGDLGGLDGADAKCQALADAAGLFGEYKAWLSDATTSAESRLNHNPRPYILVDGTVVADDWADLTDGNIDNPINLTELNETPTEDGGVWTNSDYLGGPICYGLDVCACVSWTNSFEGFAGFIGFIGSTDHYWSGTSDGPVVHCAEPWRLYCFQQ